MKKQVSFVLALLMLLALLCSCHGSSELVKFEVPEEFDTSKTYEITFWAKNDTNITQKYIYQQAVEKFQAAYPNIHVTMKSYTDYGVIYNDVITNIPTNTTPNVCISYPDHIATYLTGDNVVVPLDDLIEDEKYGLGGSELKYSGGVSKDGIIKKYLDEGILGGQQYALPFMRSSEACYINKELLEKLGYEVPDVLTWDFIWEVCDAAINYGKDEDGNYKLNGQKTLIPFIYKSTDNMMIQYTEQAGSGYSTNNGQIKIFNDTTKEFLSIIASHAENNSFSTFKRVSYPGNFFNAYQCLFAIDSTAGSTWLGSNAPLLDIDKSQVKDFTTVVRAIPQIDTENIKMISQGPSVCIFNKDDPQEVLASWLFAQYLLSFDIQLSYSQTEGYVPVTEDVRTSDQYKDYLSKAGQDNDTYYDVKIAATKLVLDNIDNTFITPVFNGSTSLREAAGELIESTVLNARKGKEFNDEYVENLYNNVISLKRLNVNGDKSEKNTELGSLPMGSKILIASVICVWVVIAAYFIIEKIKLNKKVKK